jgi:Phosphotransferase enzyme family
MIPGLSCHLIDHWDTFASGASGVGASGAGTLAGGRIPRPTAIHWLKFGSVRDFPRHYGYFYLFLDSARMPALVAKVTAEDEAKARLGRDLEQLRRVRERVPAELRPTIPAAIAGFAFGASWVSLEEFAGGERLVPQVDLARRGEKARLGTYFDRVLDWLIRFGRGSGGSEEGYAVFDGDLFQAAVDEPLARLARAHVLPGRESARLADVVSRLAGYRGQRVRVTALHGDLWPGNIFVTRSGELRIIDWEGFRERDASYHDIYTFLTSFTLAAPPAAMNEPAAVIEALFGDHWFSGLVERTLVRYARALDLDPDLVALMLPLYFVRMATRREPVHESAVAMNAKFAAILTAYLGALDAGRTRPLGLDPARRCREPAVGE